MPVSFLVDENARGPLWKAILARNRGPEPIDAVRVGDPPGTPIIPLGSPDAFVLAQANFQGRILVSFDRDTLPNELNVHLRLVGSSPGVFLIRPGFGVVDVVEHLWIVAALTTPDEWRDRCHYIP